MGLIIRPALFPAPSADYEAEKERLQEYMIPTGTERSGKQEEIRTTPLFSLAVKHAVDNITCGRLSSAESSTTNDCPDLQPAQAILPQYGLLGFHVDDKPNTSMHEPIYMNVDAPNSAFLCGSQGSGKSYTLSCMLENCLLPNEKMGKLASPVDGVVSNYDVISKSTAAEAAHLCSRGIEVNVFVSRSNERALAEVYKKIGDKHGNLRVQPLIFRSSDLSIDRMNKLMAVATKDGPTPLYMEIVQRILREMAIESDTFDYLHFRELLAEEKLTKDQTSLMSLRFSLLESFLEPADVRKVHGRKPKTKNKRLFSLKPGRLTIIDLSDTFIDASTVCLLFHLCLGLVKEEQPDSGLVIGLDEAHEYMKVHEMVKSIYKDLRTALVHNGVPWSAIFDSTTGLSASMTASRPGTSSVTEN